MVDGVWSRLRRGLPRATGGLSQPVADALCFALGAIVTKDLLSFLVYWGALDRPEVFLWPYAALPACSLGRTGDHDQLRAANGGLFRRFFC